MYNISKENLIIRGKRISAALTGKKLSAEHRLKLSLAKKGKTYPKSLGRTYKMPEGFGEKMRKLRTQEWATGQRKGGWKLSEESKKRIGLASLGRPGPMLGRTGELHWNWKGGISKDVHSVSEPKYKEWRMSVFKRDNFQCKICKSKVGLQAHHILKWAEFPELRYDLNNGITLCLVHHPRKVAEEKRLIPTFQELVSVSTDSY
jgi:hypothetical protein